MCEIANLAWIRLVTIVLFLQKNGCVSKRCGIVGVAYFSK